MSSQATTNARLHHLRSSEISSRARERTATAAPTHSGRRLTYHGGIALDLTGSASHELMPIPRVLPETEHTCFSVTGVQSKGMHFLPALGRHITAPELWETRPNEQLGRYPSSVTARDRAHCRLAVLDVELFRRRRRNAKFCCCQPAWLHSAVPTVRAHGGSAHNHSYQQSGATKTFRSASKMELTANNPWRYPS